MAFFIDSRCTGQLAENTFLVCPEGRDDCFLIDPGDDLDEIREMIKESGRKLTDILLTHGHFDHMLSAPHLRRTLGAKVHVHELDKPFLNNLELNLFRQEWCYLPLLPLTADVCYTADGETDTVCGAEMTVLHTPGHTPGCVCYWFKDENLMFTGDTLFAMGYGRIDFPGGSRRAMIDSLNRLAKLPGDIEIYPGHGAPSTIQQAVRGLMS